MEEFNRKQFAHSYFGWILAILSGPFILIFAIFFLFLVALRPYGTMLALYVLGPLCLVAITLFAFGVFLIMRARQMNPSSNSVHSLTTIPQNHLDSSCGASSVATQHLRKKEAI